MITLKQLEEKNSLLDNPVITRRELIALEKVLDKLFAKIGVDVEFTRHFLDRVNDERNIRQITLRELSELFKKEFQKYGDIIGDFKPGVEAVLNDECI